MTGFGRAEGASGAVSWVWEAKGVNGRGLDLKFRLPQGFDLIEPAARALAQARVRRGSLQIGLQVQRPQASGALRLEEAVLERLLALGAPLVAGGKATPPSLDGLLALRGVLVFEERAEGDDPAALQEALLATLGEALDALDRSRRREGEALGQALGAHVEALVSLAAQARALAAAAPSSMLARLRERLAALGAEVDPQRVAQEAALLAARGDVTEELDRLDAHLGEARALLGSDEPVGRRLDFLTQELAREANTLCAKTSELALTRLGLDLKTRIDQLREQAANVE